MGTLNKIVIASLFILLLLTGCSPQHIQIVDQLSIIVGLGVDVDEEDPRKYVFTTTNPTFGAEAEVPVFETTVKGYGIDGALKNWEYQRQNRFALGKVSTVIFGKNIAERGISAMATELRQSYDMNSLARPVYFEGKPQDAWAITPPEEPRRAVFLMNMLDRVRDQGLIPAVSLCKLNTMILNPDRDGFMPVIELSEDNDRFIISGLALLDKDGKLATTISDNEMLLFLLLTDDAIGAFTTTKIRYKGEEGIISFIVKSHSRRKTEIALRDGKPVIRLEVPIKIEVQTLQIPGVELLDREFVDTMEREIANDLNVNSQKLIEKMQQFETDPLALGQWVRVQQTAYYKRGSWRDDYPTADIRVNYRVKIARLDIITEN